MDLDTYFKKDHENNKVNYGYDLDSFKKLKRDVGNNIALLRGMNKMTQEELANLLETSQSHISSVERGSMPPSFKTLHKIAEKLNASVIPPSFDNVEERNENVEEYNKQQTLKILRACLEGVEEKITPLGHMKHVREETCTEQCGKKCGYNQVLYETIEYLQEAIKEIENE